MNKSHQRADLQITVADPDAAVIQNGNHRKVHNNHHQRHQTGHNLVDLDGSIREVFVRFGKPFILMADPVEGTDDANTCQMLAQHAVQFVQLDLNRFEQREALHSYEKNRTNQERNHHYKNQGKLGILRYSHDYPADHHHRRADHHAQHHSKDSLYLCNIIGGTCNQRRCSQLVKFMQGEILYMIEHP
ncbi:hypothetical protein D3C75_663830 [compost metagenome]